MKIVQSPSIEQIDSFLENAGESLSTFRYFQRRSVEVIKNHLVTLLYEENDQYVGYGHLDSEDGTVWLGICLSPSQIGKGSSKVIMTDLLDFARRNNVHELSLSVDVKNFRAVSLYERFGFQTYQEDDRIKFMKLRVESNG
jgi:RimJ/RimL family protein N-acetyltransferase